MHATISSTGVNISKDKNSKHLSDYIKKGSSASIRVNVENGYKILKWRGCDSVSSDLTQCYLNSVQNDKVVAPIVVYNEILYNPDIVVQDITSSKITIKNSKTYEVEASIKDSAMQTKLSNLEINNVIVSRTEPIFFKQIKSINKIDDTHYTFEVAAIPLEKIVTQGYLSSAIQGKKVIGKTVQYISPSGSKQVLKADSNGEYYIDLDKQPRASFAIDGIDIGSEDWEWVLSRDDEGNKLVFVKGGVSVKPYIDLDMGWTWSGGLEMLSIKPGVEIKPNISLEVSKEWNGFLEIQIGRVSIKQVFLVGIIPIVVTEDARLLLGAEGGVKLSYSVGADFSADIGFPFSWTKEDGVSVEETHKFKATVNMAEFKAEGYMGGYFNFMPTVSVYGIGLGLANKFGIYGKVTGTAGLKLSYDFTEDEANAEALKGEAEIYLQYQPEFRLIYPDAIANYEFIKDIKKGL